MVSKSPASGVSIRLKHAIRPVMLAYLMAYDHQIALLSRRRLEPRRIRFAADACIKLFRQLGTSERNALYARHDGRRSVA